MSVLAPVRSQQMAALEGAAVYDVEGYRLGLVESTDPEADRFTLIQAGYPLGVLGGVSEVPADWIRRGDADRVDLTVPARALEKSR